MGSSAQKNKLLHGMPSIKAKKMLLEIWEKENPCVDLNSLHPQIWKWMNIYYGLRSHNESFDIICQSFAEKISRMHGQKRVMELRIGTQRLELKKLLAEIEKLKGEKNGG